jgi:hypothetical protein
VSNASGPDCFCSPVRSTHESSPNESHPMDPIEQYVSDPRVKFVDEPARRALTRVKSASELARQSFINKTSEANTRIDNAYAAAMRFLVEICEAYRIAWESHTGILKEEKRKADRIDQYFIDVIRSFPLGGIASAVSEAVKRKIVGGFLADGIKDLVKAGLKPALTPTVVDFPALLAYPVSPQAWKVDLERAVYSERSMSEDCLRAGSGV